MDFRRFVRQCERVLKIATKPSKEEYMTSLKVITLAITLIGSIGFLIYIFMHYVLTLIGV